MAVVLGVMFVAGAFVVTDTLGRSFDSVFADAYSTTDVGSASATARACGPTSSSATSPSDRTAPRSADPGARYAPRVTRRPGR